MRPADSTQHKRASVAHAHRNLCLFSGRLSARLRCLSRPMTFNFGESIPLRRSFCCNAGRVIGMIHKVGRTDVAPARRAAAVAG